MSSQPFRLDRPSKLPLRFRVGAVGHRPNRLNDADLAALRAVVRDALEIVNSTVDRYAESCGASTPRMRVVSSLAEGADRIVAECALALGYELECPMPFAQAEYEKDFADRRSGSERESLRRFREILERARTGAGLVKLELDGRRSDASAAYRAASDSVRERSDLLIAIWDGGVAEGSGGTVETIQAALVHSQPVLWIDAASPHACQALAAVEDLPQPDTAIRSRPDPARMPTGKPSGTQDPISWIVERSMEQ